MSKNALSGLIGFGAVLAALSLGQQPAWAQEHEHGREHQGLTISTPADGATVTGPVAVAFEGGEGGHRGHGGGMQVFLLIDQPAPEPGASFQPDPNHVEFPEGQAQTSVTLAPGKHTLQLAVLDREGKIGRHFHAAEPVSVVVQ
jgi:Domain of unknown function (DUF4399)